MLAVASVFHHGESMSCSQGHIVACQVLCTPLLFLSVEQKPLVFQLTDPCQTIKPYFPLCSRLASAQT
jgi:hypothetical protein